MVTDCAHPEHPLRRWRKAGGHSITDVARSLRCSRLTVYRYEGGRVPRQPFMDRIVVLTDGAVDASAWLGKEAADVVATRPATS